MHRSGGSRWRLSESDPFDLAFALYVRDATGLDGPHVGGFAVARLEGPVPAWAADVPAVFRDHLAEQWERWWAELLAQRSDTARGPEDGPSGWVDAPDVAGTAGAPELQRVQRELFPAAHRWRGARRPTTDAADRDRLLMPTRLVSELEREIGRPARAFSYTVETLPLEGDLVRDLSPTRVLVSQRRIADADAYAEVLRPRLARLV